MTTPETTMVRRDRRTMLAVAGPAVLLAAAALYPLVFSSPLATTYGFDALIFVAAASAWNIFSGYSGYLSLGHAVFFGIGVYAVAIGARDWHLAGDAVFGLLPLAAVAAAAIAVPLGLVALRVRRHTFVVITIAFFFIFQLMAFNFSFTGGTSGIDAPILNWSAATYNDPFYYLALVIAAAAVALSWLIRRSRFGLHLRAIRDDEDRARGLGVHAMRVKLAALVISALITGLAGGLWYYFIGAAHPQSAFDPLFDLSLALMGFFGGLGTVFGPVLGALILEPSQQWLTVQFTNDYLSEILLGVLFLLVILFLPRGVLPTLGEWADRWRARSRAGRKPRPTALPCSQTGSRKARCRDRRAAYRGDQQGLRWRTGPGRLRTDRGRGLDHRPDRAERVREDHAVQHRDRLRAARRRRGVPGWAADHRRVRAAGVRPRPGPDVPADQDLPPAHAAGEHAGRGRGPRGGPAPGARAAGVHRDRPLRRRPGRDALLRPAQAARTGHGAGREQAVVLLDERPAG